MAKKFDVECPHCNKTYKCEIGQRLCPHCNKSRETEPTNHKIVTTYFEKTWKTKIVKLERKLKMMEIAFEQINNSRNDLLRQLAECELKLNENSK